MEIIERVERVCQSFIERERKIKFQGKCQKLAEILFEQTVILGKIWGSDYTRSAEGLVPEAHGEKHIRIEAKRGHWNTSLTGPPSLAFPTYEILVHSYIEEAREGGSVNITINKDPDMIIHLNFYDYSKGESRWELRRKMKFHDRYHEHDYGEDRIFDPEYVQRWIKHVGEWRFLR